MFRNLFITLIVTIGVALAQDTYGADYSPWSNQPSIGDFNPNTVCSQLTDWATCTTASLVTQCGWCNCQGPVILGCIETRGDLVGSCDQACWGTYILAIGLPLLALCCCCCGCIYCASRRNRNTVFMHAPAARGYTTLDASQASGRSQQEQTNSAKHALNY